MDKEIKEFVKRGLETVEKLLKAENYLDTAKACQEILQVDPGNRRARKMLEKAQSFINQEKDKLLKKNLPSLKQLYKEGKYAEAVEMGEKLHITNAITAKAQKKLLKKQQNELKAYLKKGFKTHKKLGREKKWLEAIEILKEMLQVSPRNEEIKSLLKRDKIKYIDQQLHSDVRDQLIESKEYEKLYKFYQKLYFLFPQHKKLLSEIKNAEKLILRRRRTENKAFIIESVKKAKELFAKGDFEAAIQVAKEILKLTDGEQGMKLYKKSAVANERDTEKKLSTKLTDAVAKLHEEFKANPKGFVKV